MAAVWTESHIACNLFSARLPPGELDVASVLTLSLLASAICRLFVTCTFSSLGPPLAPGAPCRRIPQTQPPNPNSSACSVRDHFCGSLPVLQVRPREQLQAEYHDVR